VTIITGLDLPLGSPGGSVALVHDLYLAPDGNLDADVFMLAGGVDEPSPRAPGPVTLAVDGKQLEGPGFWAYVDALAAAIRQRFRAADYDVVHLQHLAFGATPALLRAFPAHQHLALVHGTDLLFAADNPTQLEVLREAVTRAMAVVVPATAMVDQLTALGPIRIDHIHHIPWGVPDWLLATPPPRGEAGTELRILYAGRLTAEKGVTAVVKILSDVPCASLSIAAPVAEYRVLSRELDVSAVRYLGWLTRPELWQMFGAHDLLVVPSTRLEAFGLVAVEAQACGLPVLYAPVPGLVEVLGDTAIAVDLTADPRRAAAVVTDLCADQTALTDLREAGFRNAARFPLSRTARELSALSRQIQL
jgi:glycosyltransferase involved in cell wall biosynthesis